MVPYIVFPFTSAFDVLSCTKLPWCQELELVIEEFLDATALIGREVKPPSRQGSTSTNELVHSLVSKKGGEYGSLQVDYFTFSSSIADNLRSASLVVDIF
ncbi:hypothetical protein Vadar_029137 [Vaccinium darrowii]|uniref:Uncharacterized protein n=1 Tax=Vaccinium darrowii TaxID=229202 RepID=A0ACB7ZNN7_9ERIC|nr:hypothetical protein Vadar_029137 [Vaccinium darrowii]